MKCLKIMLPLRAVHFSTLHLLAALNGKMENGDMENRGGDSALFSGKNRAQPPPSFSRRALRCGGRAPLSPRKIYNARFRNVIFKLQERTL